MSGLFQFMPLDTVRDAEVIVNSMPATALLSWMKGQRVTCRLDARNVELRPTPWDFTLLPCGIDSWWLSTPEASNGVLHLRFDPNLLERVIEAEGLPSSMRAFHTVTIGEDPIVRETARWLCDRLLDEEPPSPA